MTENVWEAKVDDRFEVRVERLGDYEGKLIVYDPETKKTLLEQKVGLSFRAIFGPDADDVAHWQNLALEVIDA